MINRNPSAIGKFEEFFNENYKDEILSIIEEYPDKTSLIVNYEEFDKFDSRLADLLIDKPEIIIDAAKKAIQNVEPLGKSMDINIRFDNLPTIPLDSARSKYTGKFISIEGIIKEIEEPLQSLNTATFECKGCLRLHKVEQPNTHKLIEPSVCSECGGRSFRLLPSESDYADYQKLVIGMNIGPSKTSRTLMVVLDNDLVSQDGYNLGQHVKLTGILTPIRNKNGQFNVYLNCNYLQTLPDILVDYDDTEVSENEYGARGTPEYNAWKNEVLNRDAVCQCCGSEKHPVAHHIFGYEDHPEYRVHADNGIRLCKWCHGKYHSHYGIRHANPITLIEFIQRFGSNTFLRR